MVGQSLLPITLGGRECSAVRGWGMSTQLAMCIGVLALYTLHTGVTLRWPNEDSLSWRAGLSQDMQQ